MIKILIIILSSIIFSGCNRIDNHQPLTDTNIDLSKSNSIAQSFVASENNLNIVSICIRNPRRELFPLEFNLYKESLSSEPIRTIQFSSGNIDNKDCTKFQFEPVMDSRENLYISEIFAADTDLSKIGYFAEAYSINDLSAGQAFLDYDPKEYNLHFKTFYKQEFSEIISVDSLRFTERLGQDKYFSFTMLVIIMILIIVTLRNK